MNTPFRRPFDRFAARRRAEGLAPDRLPPGQYVSRGWPVLHYGKVPPIDLATWDLQVYGETASGERTSWDRPAFDQLPRTDLTSDLHCVTRWTLLDSTWSGVAGATLLERVPPAAGVTHVLVWAEYGYSANVSLADFAGGMLATHRNGKPLTPEHGWPLRLVVPRVYAWKNAKWVRAIEYLDVDRRGFWEERGYHNRADPWQEERYSYQEDDRT